MKNVYCITLVVLFLCMVLLPLCAAGGTEAGGDGGLEPTADTFRVKVGEETVTLSAKEYICGVMAAEMPALYETEALKAQAVAAYTYAVRKRQAAAGAAYDITADSGTDQAYISVPSQKEKWGDKYEEYSEKIAKAQGEVAGQVLTYGSEVILAAYHSLSAGATEAAVNVWGTEYPYLQSVESAEDMLSKDYLSKVSVPLADFKAALSDTELSDEPTAWFGECERTAAGTVKKLPVCQSSFTGSEIRKIFGLRSSNFDVAVNDGEVVFTVRGYGHGVGMSQYGANCMAKNGSDYKEILARYYKGTEIKDFYSNPSK